MVYVCLLHGHGSLGDKRNEAALNQITAGLNRLGPLFMDAGLHPPKLPTLTTDPGEVSGELKRFNDSAIVALTAADFQVGKGYTAGRKLANMSSIPRLCAPLVVCDEGRSLARGVR
jgi:hypothetical protein